MKSFLFIYTILLLISPPEWLTDFEQATVEAKKNDQLILLNFAGSDWCAPCIRMKKDVFDDPAFLEYASTNLVLVRADFPRLKKNQLAPEQKAHNEQLANRYNPNGKFPLTLLLRGDGQVIYEWDGFSGGTANDFVKQIEARSHGN